ncbi:MAG: tRNA (guanosine(37)-N1)-methyltransferase TrmD [Nitrospirae bacterium]|nr:tRNA (guanosine(37)-N1)-methyltransferase TrmD [Nitrospirota bacterium]
MRCDILTLFPELITSVVSQSIVKRAQDKGLVTIHTHNIRDYTNDPHRNADDSPYGGGAGMVMKAEPILQIIDELRAQGDALRVIVPSPQGAPFTQNMAHAFSIEKKRLVWLCGHYEGIDERVIQALQPEEVSIGDYVVTGGELPALVMIDAAVRLVPGVLGDPDSALQDSFMNSLLDFPHYTRPEGVRGFEVPEVLRSGNHEAIRRWRRKAALFNTYHKRPDLLDPDSLNAEDRQILEEIVQEDRLQQPVGKGEEG